jgi:hypothetical protein
MRVIAKFFCATIMAASLATAGTMVGWISDASCGSGNGNGEAASRDCAKRCINGGAAPVFVSEADQKVYKLDGGGGDAAKKHLDYKVKVTGDVKGDTIKVSEIKKAS